MSHAHTPPAFSVLRFAASMLTTLALGGLLAALNLTDYLRGAPVQVAMIFPWIFALAAIGSAILLDKKLLAGQGDPYDFKAATVSVFSALMLLGLGYLGLEVAVVAGDYLFD